EKDVSNDLNLSLKRNAELNIGRFSRIMIGIVGGGIGASPDVVIVAMVKGVIIGSSMTVLPPSHQMVHPEPLV
nr:hypothetical protein [Tanacetum cinerariifolium]